MPKRIGKYEITAEIGRGGFSRVYRGFDPNVNRPIAIKVSTRESDPEHLSRFRNEASAAGNLRHENIVTVYDYGDDDGVPYLVMELLEGRDLHHIMRDGPKMSLLEKMQVMSQVGEGLRCAHLNGVVHRDIKPANVMVLTDGTVKILDFGIARMTGEVSRLTQSGYLVGTPLYMSPEQLQGGDADALCDVWAYGVLYFELLAGQHPFLSQDNTRLVRNITIVNPPSVHSLTRGVPEGLAQVIRRALTKDRRRRYQSLEEVLVDTNPILALLQREQTTGLVSEAQFYKNSGQLAAARQSSRRALEIDPSNFGAQQLLKSIQHEMQEERLAAPIEVSAHAQVPAKPVSELRSEPTVAAPVSVPPPPPAPVRITPPSPARQAVEEDVLASAVVSTVTDSLKATSAVLPALPVPAVRPEATPVAAVSTPVPVPSLASAAAALSTAPAVAPVGHDTPAVSTTQRLRPALTSGGAAAAIAAAVAAAKARQAEEERQQKEHKTEEESSAPLIKATPLVVSASPASRVTPTPQPIASLRRAEDGSAVFFTDDPLVVKRPAAAVLSQRMNSSDSTAAVATPVPAPPPPPTRLPGAKAIPTSVSRSLNGTTTETNSPTSNSLTVTDSRRPSENLPMRRPPSEVYAKGRRKNSGVLFADKKQKKAFPWAVIGFVAAVALAAVMLIMFALSAPRMMNTPALQPEKLTFAWKTGAPKPHEQILRLKGGPSAASYTASSSDDEWLIVTPQSDETTNRSWQVKVDPEKIGTTGPNGTSGWIDVVSTEGFKTQEEVVVKVTASDVVPSKAKKTPPTAVIPPSPAIVTPPAARKPGAAAPTVTSLIEKDRKGGAMPASTPAASVKTNAAALPAVKGPAAAASKKPPVNDGIDTN